MYFQNPWLLLMMMTMMMMMMIAVTTSDRQRTNRLFADRPISTLAAITIKRDFTTSSKKLFRCQLFGTRM